MKRTLIVFFSLVATVFLFDQLARRVLGLDCMGPVLPAWGCLAEPYPTTLGAAGFLLGRYRPELVKKLAGEEEPRGYRTR